MKKNIFLWLILIAIAGLSPSVYTQPKYYQVKEKLSIPSEDWRDTLFVVKVSDPLMQAEFDQELSLDWEVRSKIISGALQAGNGGFNRNDSHCFSWHMIDESVHLADLTTEVCDGKPYQDCELSNFVENVGFFCPWGMNLWAEIPPPQDCNLAVDSNTFNIVKVYPNPFSDKIYFETERINSELEVAIYNSLGILVYSKKIESRQENEISLQDITSGVYILVLRYNNMVFQKRIIKQ